MLKTNKALLKRVKITKTGKVLRNPLSKNHYQSKLSGRKKQTRRKMVSFSKPDLKFLNKYLPHK